MKVIKAIFLVIVIALNFNCSAGNSCDIKKVEKIYSIPLGYHEKASFIHLVLFTGIDKGCFDSSLIVKNIETYISTLNNERPVSAVEVFNSIKNFDMGESLSQPKSIYRNCIVEVWFDSESMKPREFIFYDRGGNKVYEGNRWKPEGE